MKIAWFSPLPPEHTDIANYTRRLSRELRAHFETRFFTEKPGGFLEPATGHAYPTNLGAVPAALVPELNHVDLPIYHLGNNPVFFSHTWFLGQHKPGIVVLHDLKLHHFFEGIYRERLGDQAAYLRIMRRDYGHLGYEAGVAYWRQEVSIDFMAEHFPMTPWAVRGALALVVHTAHALAVLRRLTNIPVVFAPLPYEPQASRSLTPGPSKNSPAAFSPSHRARLIIFGYLNVNRRVVEFLTALAEMPERHSFDVHIYGTVFHRPEVDTAITALGLRDRVSLHGHVSEPILEAALQQADLAVNLRYPSMGEASGTQLRLWDHALPSLVTHTEGYTGLPADAAFFVRIDHETADIQQHLRGFLADPARFRAAGERGREILLHDHSPAGYVAQVSAFCQHAATLRSRHNQLNLADRVGTALAPWLDAVPSTAREEHYAGLIAATV